MKTKVSILLVLLSFMLSAQFNNTYDINANTDYLYPSFDIPTRDLGSVSVSWGLDAPSSPRTDYFILTKHDAYGNVVFNVRIDPASPTVDGFTHVKALIETEDRGILVAGYYYYDNTFTLIPFLLKVDVNGVYQWTRFYPISSNFFIGWQFNKISLCRVEDDDKENYFIVSSAESDLRSGDAAIAVTKVDASGAMIWSKKYYDSNLFNNPYSTVRDIPGDVAFSKDYRMYMLTGWRQQWIFGQEDRIFFFGIDRDGNILTPYKSIDVPGYPFGEDMIYDPNTRLWAITYTHGNTNYSGDPNVASGIGLITIDQTLTLFLRKFYWHKEGLENYGVSISLSDLKDYVIGCFVYEDWPLSKRNPALLKVDNSGTPIFFKRYNIKDDAIFGHHCMSYNPNTSIEEYVLIAEQNKDLRVIRTDINGKTCGAFDYEPKSLDFHEDEEWFKYYAKENGYDKEYTPQPKDIQVKYRKCYDDGSSYREVATTSIAEQNASSSSLNVYPNPSNGRVFVNTSEGQSFLVYDITGKIVDCNKTKVNDQTSEINIGSEGIYLIKIFDASGETIDARKVIIVK
ncbi:MAG: T9SS type A sorting domain-containing protein [Bacteroidia bacterium]|nr:T9SS type A sorting domain-containing protein [Bacteroidia bacterium]